MRANAKSTPEQLASVVPPPPFDRTTFVQKAKLKANLICPTILSYLRKVCKEKFFGDRTDRVSILLTRPCDLDYEEFVFKTYLSVLEHLITVWVERETKLEDDLPLYEATDDWQMKMVIRYRIERKKIFRQ